MTTSKYILTCALCLLTQAVVFSQNTKKYPLVGNWEAIPETIELAPTAAYPVAFFVLKLEPQKHTVPVIFGSIAEGGVKTDYPAFYYNAVLKKADLKNKKKFVFKALYPFANKKGKVRISLVHPDTLLWETLWLPSSVTENYIPKRAKLVRR